MPPTPPPPSPCLDKNQPNDPEYCQNTVGTLLAKITKCKQSSFANDCQLTCGYCPAPLPQPTSPPSRGPDEAPGAS
eukprot:scaffold117016_cov62-Phaeocystis_antarctica.AAC.2